MIWFTLYRRKATKKSCKNKKKLSVPYLIITFADVLAAKDNKPQTETTDNSMATLPANDTPAHHSVSDEMADYSMLDNEDIYSLLASN